jgi:CRP-like cAMP-binding protein
MSEHVWWPARREGLSAYLDDAELLRFQAVTELAEVGPGAVVLHRDAPSRSVLVIEEGELEVVEEKLGELRVLAVMGQGDVAGELGFVDGWPRSQDVRARTACRVRRLTREKLMELASSDPPLFGKLSISLAVILAARFREIMAELAPVRAFAASLQEPLEEAVEPDADGGELGAFDALEDDAGGDALSLLRQIADKTSRGSAGL